LLQQVTYSGRATRDAPKRVPAGVISGIDLFAFLFQNLTDAAITQMKVVSDLPLQTSR